MRPKDSCPVWREDAGKVPNGNSPTSYSTARRDLWGRCRATGTSTRQVVSGSTLQLLSNRTQDHEVPPNRRAKLTVMPDEPSTPEICDRPSLAAAARHLCSVWCLGAPRGYRGCTHLRGVPAPGKSSKAASAKAVPQ